MPKKAEDKDSKELATLQDVELVIAPASPIVFNNNFDEQKTLLKKELKKYKGMKVTDANFDKCKFVQKQCVTTRNLLETRRKEVIKAYLDLPKDFLNSQFAEMLSLVAEVEDNIKKQMDVYEQERIEELRLALSEYKDRLQAEDFKLEDKFFSKVELKSSYFNKTAKEADSREDIKMQFLQLERDQRQHKADVELIKQTVGDNKVINLDKMISRLTGESASEIVMDIKEELTRLASIEEPKTVVGAEITFSDSLSAKATKLASKKPVMKSMSIKITYREDLGGAIQEFFAENGITVQKL